MNRSYGTQFLNDIPPPEINFGATKCFEPTALLIEIFRVHLKPNIIIDKWYGTSKY
jgi:hypothetical protein